MTEPLAAGFHVTSDHDPPPDLPAMTLMEKLDEPWDTKGWALRGRSRLWLGRPLFTGQPDEWKLSDRCNLVARAGGWVQLGNEWNHEVEQWPGGASQEGLNRLATVWSFVRTTLLSTDMLGWGAASPDKPFYRETFDLDRNQERVSALIEGAPFLILHAYGPHERVKNLVYEVHQRWPHKTIWLAEYNWGQGNPKPRGWDDGVVDTLSWLDSLRVRGGGPDDRAVVAATAFAWYWKDGPNDVDLRATPVEAAIERFVAGDRAGSYAPERWPGVPAPGGDPVPDPEEPPTDPVPGPRVVRPYHRKVLTVWNLPRKPGDLVAWMQRLGMDTVEIKVCDGDSPWLGRRNVTPEYVKALRDVGLIVCGWGYHYCDERVNAGDRGNGIPEDEGRVAARMVKALDLSGYTWDLEIESERATEAEANKAAWRMFAAYSKELGDHPNPEEGAHIWPYKTGHLGYPWGAIKDRVDVLRPMIYQDDWDGTRSFSDRELGPYYREHGTVAPVMGITDSGATVAALERDWQIYKAAKVVGFGVWEYAGLPGQDGVLDWLAARDLAAELPDSGQDGQDTLRGRFDVLWGKMTEFRTALEGFDTRGDPALEQMKLGLLAQAGHPMNALVGLAKKAKGLE